MFRRQSAFKLGAGHAGTAGGPGPWGSWDWPPGGGPGPWWPAGGPGPWAMGGGGVWWPTGGPGPWSFGRDNDPRAHAYPNMLVVRLRPSAANAPAFTSLASGAMSHPGENTGLSFLELLQRGGRINRVRPLSREVGAEARNPSDAIGGPQRAMKTLHLTANHRSSIPESTHRPDLVSGVSFIELASDVDVADVHGRLSLDPHVEFVDRVPVRYLDARATQRRRIIRPMRAAPAVAALWNLQKIKWAEARATTGFRDANSIKVAVLDTGVDDSHPDLAGRIAEYVFEHPDIPDASGRKDLVGHGTHVSGIIAADINNNIGINGICSASICMWKIFTDRTIFDPGSGIFSYFVDPVMYHRALADVVARSDVKVLNLSIGGPGRPDANESALFAALIRAGVTVVAAMGNEREAGSPTSFPAAIPGVVAVGATGIDDTVASFSNAGNHIALGAPGVGIWSTLPTYAGQDGFYAVAGPGGAPMEGKPIKRETNYDAWDGTSMATPHVTAAVALRFAKKGLIAPTRIRSDLENSADKVPAMNGQAFSADYGFGRLNLLQLLNLP